MSAVATTNSPAGDADAGTESLADPASFAEALRVNDAAFQRLLPGLLETDRDRCALLREGSLIKTFDTVSEAASHAQRHYSDGLYMLRKVMPLG